MPESKYTIETGSNFRVQELDSDCPKGTIRKIIQYTRIDSKKYFNVGFGDKNSITNDMDDLVVTNNNDSQKALTAVAA